METVISDMETRRGRSRRGLLIILSIGIVLIAGAWWTLHSMQVKTRTQPADLLADFGAVPNQELTERSGQKMSLGEFKGKIWVASFIFTSCGGSCPAMSTKMRDLQESLKKAGDVKLVSFSVDPEHDTPERLTTYAKSFDAQEGKWFFMTAPKEQMQDLAKNSFHLAMADGTDPKEPIIHSSRLILIDQEGHIRGYYGSDDDEAQPKLLHDIGTLMRGDGR